MRTRHAIRMLTLLTAVSVLPARAQAQLTVTPFAGMSFAGETGFVDLEQAAGTRKAVYGVSAGWRMARRWTVGFEGTVMPKFLKGDGEVVERGRLTSFLAQLDYGLWPGSRSTGPQLFLTGGIGVVRVDIDDVFDAFTASSTLPAGHVGAGVTLPLGSRLRLRNDVRYVRTTSKPGSPARFDDGYASFWRVTSGVEIAF